MANRFICRKITVKSHSRQGWVLSSRESYAVYDRDWKKYIRGFGDEEIKYVPFSEFNSKAFVQALAKYLNENTESDRPTRVINGFGAKMEIMRAAGFTDNDSYGMWVEKFDPEFQKK